MLLTALGSIAETWDVFVAQSPLGSRPRPASEPTWHLHLRGGWTRPTPHRQRGDHKRGPPCGAPQGAPRPVRRRARASVRVEDEGAWRKRGSRARPIRCPPSRPPIGRRRDVRRRSDGRLRRRGVATSRCLGNKSLSNGGKAQGRAGLRFRPLSATSSADRGLQIPSHWRR
jgi:hypothetical protein